MIENSLSSQHLVLVPEASPASAHPLPHMHYLALTPELSESLSELKTFDLRKCTDEQTETEPPQHRAIQKLIHLLEDPKHYDTAVGFLQSPSASSYCVRAPGKGGALLYALAMVRHPEMEPYLRGVLNALGKSVSPNEEIVKLVGSELLCASDLTKIGLSDRSRLPRRVISEALDIFSRLSCFSLSHNPGITDWVKFLNQEVDKLHVIELTQALAQKLNKQHAMSGYEHITAVLKGCREQEYALARLNRLSKATVRNGSSVTALPDETPPKRSGEIPAPFVVAVSLIPAVFQILAQRVSNIPLFAQDTVIGIAVALIIRELVNVRIRSEEKSKTGRKTSKEQNPAIISWNNFFEKFDSMKCPSPLDSD